MRTAESARYSKTVGSVIETLLAYKDTDAFETVVGSTYLSVRRSHPSDDSGIVYSWKSGDVLEAAKAYQGLEDNSYVVGALGYAVDYTNRYGAEATAKVLLEYKDSNNVKEVAEALANTARWTQRWYAVSHVAETLLAYKNSKDAGKVAKSLAYTAAKMQSADKVNAAAKSYLDKIK